MFNDIIVIDEIFKSINGETTMSGTPTIFIRTMGCNLKCSYCDTIQDISKAKPMTVKSIIDEVKNLNCANICITGGEPLKQKNIYTLIHSLTSRGYNVYIETNGSVEIPSASMRRHRYIMDVKCPSSGESENMRLANLTWLSPQDEVKFVVANKEDFEYALNVLKNFPTRAHLLFSPMFEENNTKVATELVDWLLNSDLENWRVQLQIHKLINVM